MRTPSVMISVVPPVGGRKPSRRGHCEPVRRCQRAHAHRRDQALQLFVVNHFHPRLLLLDSALTSCFTRVSLRVDAREGANPGKREIHLDRPYLYISDPPNSAVTRLSDIAHFRRDLVNSVQTLNNSNPIRRGGACTACTNTKYCPRCWRRESGQRHRSGMTAGNPIHSLWRSRREPHQGASGIRAVEHGWHGRDRTAPARLLSESGDHACASTHTLLAMRGPVRLSPGLRRQCSESVSLGQSRRRIKSARRLWFANAATITRRVRNKHTSDMFLRSELDRALDKPNRPLLIYAATPFPSPPGNYIEIASDGFREDISMHSIRLIRCVQSCRPPYQESAGTTYVAMLSIRRRFSAVPSRFGIVNSKVSAALTASSSVNSAAIASGRPT